MIWEWFATLGPAKWVAWVMLMTAVPLFLLFALWLFLPFGIYGSKRRLERLIFLNQQILTELVRLRRIVEGPDAGSTGPGTESEGQAGEITPPAPGGDTPPSLAGETEPPAAYDAAESQGADPRQVEKADDLS